MKKMFLFLLLSIASLASAQEIFREDFEAVILKNQTSFEEVKQGMVSGTIGVNLVITDEQGRKHLCTQIVQRTVLEVSESRYLTHEKVENFDDCQGNLVAGEVNEHLRWNRRFKVEEYLDFMAKNYYSSFFQNNELITLNGITSSSNGERSAEFIMLIDSTKSQFYSASISRVGDFSSIMFERSWSDPTKIKLEGLEVQDYTSVK